MNVPRAKIMRIFLNLSKDLINLILTCHSKTEKLKVNINRSQIVPWIFHIKLIYSKLKSLFSKVWNCKNEEQKHYYNEISKLFILTPYDYFL